MLSIPDTQKCVECGSSPPVSLAGILQLGGRATAAISAAWSSRHTLTPTKGTNFFGAALHFVSLQASLKASTGRGKPARHRLHVKGGENHDDSVCCKKERKGEPAVRP
jgi:hypothetical protein